MKYIFAGTPEFAAIILERLLQVKLKPLAVLTVSDKPVGRKQLLTPPPVKILAQKNKLEVIQPSSLKNNDQLYKQLKDLKLDLIITAALGLLVPKELLTLTKFGWLNVHPSFLPKYRGPSPIQTAILNGEAETGTTLMLMNQGLDTGPIIAQAKLAISPVDTTPTLSKKLTELSAELLLTALPDYLAGKVKPQPQDNKQATITKIITKEDGLIDWHRSASEIERQYRAFSPWPGIYTFWQNKRLQFLAVEAINYKKLYPVAEIGKVSGSQNDLLITCQTGQLKIKKLKLEGKRELPVNEFLSGYRNILQSKL